MGDADQDKVLREMAENRGLRLVKSRRRKPGGDFGRYGLKEKEGGKEVFGFGKTGLTAGPEEIEAHLRDYMVADWKSSLKQAAETPKPEAKPKDAEAIAALIGELGFEASTADVAKRMRALARAGEALLVAERGGVIGCLSWHVTPVVHRPTPVGRVTMLVVTEKARRDGVGEALVAEAEARVAAKGCALIEVTSNIQLGGAHQFYRRIGFERTSYRFVKPLSPG